MQEEEPADKCWLADGPPFVPLSARADTGERNPKSLLDFYFFVVCPFSLSLLNNIRRVDPPVR